MQRLSETILMSYYSYSQIVDMSVLVGKTLSAVDHNGDELVFRSTNGGVWVMAHNQDCCESVYIESISGDLGDLVGAPIITSYESHDTPDEPLHASDAEYGSYTWTFYRISTVKGTVCIRWYGSSNGYYSESVDLFETEEENSPAAGELIEERCVMADYDGQLSIPVLSSASYNAEDRYIVKIYKAAK